MSPTSDTVAEERLKATIHESDGAKGDGIRLLGLCKTYYHYPFSINSAKDVKAVDSVYLEVEPDELVAMLGHNGAGKSTLINVLTGVLNPTAGQARICGFDVEEEMDEIRRFMGYCPQHDILWNELTAKDHLRLFARLKNVPKKDIESTIDRKLTEVNLLDVGNAVVGTYSGGMKRRLSVAISGIGNPKVLILDEPTTGMDPISRRQVWWLIKGLKKNRVMLLTTHSMEEADVLSDRIVVVVDGKFKCIGTSLSLKNQYGDGYRFSLVTADPEQVKSLVSSSIPSATLIDESAGSLVFATKVSEDFYKFFEAMEGSAESPSLQALYSKVTDWGISHTTLEEVFMRVTGKKHAPLSEPSRD